MNSEAIEAGQLQWRPQWENGSRRWLVRDPWSLQHFKFTELQRSIWCHLKTGLSPVQIAEQLRIQFPGHRVHQDDVSAFVRDLQAAGLSPSRQWGSRPSRIRRASRVHSWWSPWTIRVPLFDPTSWLRNLGWLAHLCFHPLMFIAVTVVAFLLALHAVGSIDVGAIDWSRWRQSDVWLGTALSLAITKSCHELGHALACRRYGVECHEIGMLWLFCLPCLYCDVSDSWQLPSRWQRVMIALAGIYVELMIAILAYSGWWLAVPGTFQSVMLLTALSASVGTILINANPLLRYDGYFILSDVLNWPNLWQDASQALRNIVGWSWGIRTSSRTNTSSAVPLISFALASLGYRLFLTGSLLLACQQLFPLRSTPVLSALLMSGLMMPWVANLLATLKHLASGQREGWPYRWSKRLLLLSCMFAAAYAFCVVPFTTQMACRAKCRSVLVPVFAPAAGTLVTWQPDGSSIQPAQPLVELRDFNKEQLLRKLRTEVQVHEAAVERTQAQEATDPLSAQLLPALKSILVGKRDQLQLVQDELNRLKILAPSAGVWSCAMTSPAIEHSTTTNSRRVLSNLTTTCNADTIHGCGIEKGALLGRIQTDEPAIVEAYLPEADLDLLELGRLAQLRLDCWPDQEIAAEIIEVLPKSYSAHATDWPLNDPLLNTMEHNGQRRLADGYLVVRMKLGSHQPLLLSENWAIARLPARSMTCAERCWRWFQVTFKSID